MTSLRAHKTGEVLAALGNHQVTTGATLAAAVNVSERTIYRYVRELRAAGHPILSEAGMGYLLKAPKPEVGRA
ncbi:helix-turn-helix domain-containing protein [Mesorhizobium sp. M4A.F.Ca.ET.020.02.1.1]|uniref:helix-turn-helix domain-containing protein n=1 Tax=Mesorhizobium sp. M4A.F.Ca.ET.020.02.1.1 TaxID=2496652 RepID=UPI000FD37DDD|nr:helix-turn-helix domain-containing protein [Mesorhizobium sp. M4A.F.Ca.ET.020.02.1.1]RVD44920.1 helix-turn-helix domain-containing protein [Mesorhizobium sp. M4A.F.Ca.ET.020.02.1.1]